MKQRAVVLLGANLGNRVASIRDALVKLEELFGKPEKLSSLYETSAWGVEHQPDYLNCVVGFFTELTPQEILFHLLDTEKKAGRIRGEVRYEARVIDLDLLLFGKVILHEPGLQVPHPRMTLRRFTLMPLAEIYPTLIHPENGYSIQELLDQCTDQGRVQRITENA